jgi:hypothetical protein
MNRLQSLVVQQNFLDAQFLIFLIFKILQHGTFSWGGFTFKPYHALVAPKLQTREAKNGFQQFFYILNRFSPSWRQQSLERNKKVRGLGDF